MKQIDMKMKKIGIDARFYGPLGKGLGRYTQEVVDGVIKLDDVNDYVVFLHPENFDAFKIAKPNVKKVLVKARWYSLAEQILMPYHIWREKIDLMHFPHFNVPILCPTKFIVTIHDLILTKFPTTRATTLGPLMYRLKNLGYRLIIANAVRRSQLIIAVSEFTKSDIVRNFTVRPDKIEVTYEGVARIDGGENTANNDADKKIVLGYNISSPYLLYVGNAYPHKNLEGMLRVFSKLRGKNSTLKLVLVGKEDYFYRRVKEYARSLESFGNDDSPVIFPGYVPDGELSALYRNASLYAFFSLYEGFGLPPLEAMSMGCAVASSDRASMPEILGDGAAYFDPENEDEAGRLIDRLIGDEAERKKLISKGYEIIKRYDWHECAVKTLSIYNKA